MDCRARRRDLDDGGAPGLPMRPAADLLRDGARRPVTAWAARVHPVRRIPHVTTLITGIAVTLAALIGDAAETYDLTNIGTLFAFAIVCAGVLVLRYTDPDRPRPFGCRSSGPSPCSAPPGACSSCRAAAASLGALRPLARDRSRAVAIYGYRASSGKAHSSKLKAQAHG